MLTMKKRLKGAIDSRIAEEQARQRALQTTPSRSNSTARKPPSRSSSPAVRAARRRPTDNGTGDPTAKGPDPKDFEPEFVIGDEELLSRKGTPQPQDGRNPDISEDGQTEKATSVDSAQVESKDAAVQDEAPAAVTELPKEVRVKLRKLERLESRYQGKKYILLTAGWLLTGSRAVKSLSTGTLQGFHNRAVRICTTREHAADIH